MVVQFLFDLLEAVGGKAVSVNSMPIADVEAQFVADSSIALSWFMSNSPAWNIAHRLLQLVIYPIQMQNLWTVSLTWVLIIISPLIVLAILNIFTTVRQ